MTDAAPDLEALYTRYRGYVATIALRVLGDVSQADDVTQDVFLLACRKLHHLRDPSAARFWLGRIAVREARRTLRRRSMLRWVGMDAVPERSYVAPDASPAQRAQVIALYDALDLLPANQRIAWTLRHIEGETLPRVAELSGCSLATAKRWLARAQRRLEELLDD